MSLVVLEHVDIGFGGRALVWGLDLRIDERDRIGLVGPNGSGKTSLMRVLAGTQSASDGAVRPRRQLRIGYLPQELDIGSGKTVLRHVLDRVPGRADLQEQARRAQAELDEAQQRGDEAALMDAASWIADVHDRLSHVERDFSEHEARRILAGLGLGVDQHDRPIDELSGGWKMRVELAAVLFRRPELILLDEPTNHLDMPSVAWLGGFLRSFGHAFVLICHDREFLNEQVDRIVAIEPEGVRQFRGNYDGYVRQRSEEEIVLENQAKNLQRTKDKAEQFIERFRAQANKAKAVQSRIKQLEKLDDVRTFSRRKHIRFRFPACQRTGDEVVRIEGLAKSFGGHRVLDGVELSVRRGQRIGIIGVNGAGKTTLLRMIAGEISADRGTIKLGHNVKSSYYAQHHTDVLDRNRTVFEEVAAHNRSRSETEVRTLLGAFLFQGDDVDKRIGVLSGGERARVALARMLTDPGNFLLLDEPTNHLDLDSSESLAQSLAEFDGTIVFVSHNRSFVRKLSTQIWNVHDGMVEPYPGTLDEYLQSYGATQSAVRAETKPAVDGAAERTAPTDRAEKLGGQAREQRRHSRADRLAQKRNEAESRAQRKRRIEPLHRRVKQLEAEIAAVEQIQRGRNLELADPALYEDAPRRDALLIEYQRDNAKLAELNDAWEVAQAELDAVEREN